ncbi:protein FAM136A-like [Osmia bicornis bicornis]|uniref:protein FAM136A-like n=1 Tax=Osmia bicornis bicornis TaxID=1437191 RepID=UPI0010F6207B|nr:protein FAM136A-like [Osmia bicornis bicornis]
MLDEQQQRYKDQTSKVVEEINKPIRKMQGDAYRCAANCCDNEKYSMQHLQDCVENCTDSWDRAQKYVGGELERVQNRLQRCFMDCYDKIKDQVGPNPSQRDMDIYKDQMDKCSTKCLDNYCEMLPTLEKRIKEVLAERKYE